MKIWIFLPAFNEAESIPRMFPKIRETMEAAGHDYEIVLLDDGSTDNTQAELDKIRDAYPLRVICHDINRGLGETERDGFEYLAREAAEDDVIVRFDCDDTHEPRYIVDMIQALDNGHDVVNTSRFQPGGGQFGVTGRRSYLSYGANIFMRLVFNVPGVRDYSCGYRAYRGAILKDAVAIFGNSFIQMKGFGFTSTLETIVKLKLMGCRFAEVPFVHRYDQKISASKMVASVTTLGYMVMAVLYHWPWGGWRRWYRGLPELYRKSPSKARERFAPGRAKRSTACRIGG